MGLPSASWSADCIADFSPSHGAAVSSMRAEPTRSVRRYTSLRKSHTETAVGVSEDVSILLGELKRSTRE